jgi:hypothetical protein
MEALLSVLLVVVNDPRDVAGLGYGCVNLSDLLDFYLRLCRSDRAGALVFYWEEFAIGQN